MLSFIPSNNTKSTHIFLSSKNYYNSLFYIVNLLTMICSTVIINSKLLCYLNPFIVGNIRKLLIELDEKRIKVV